jgi:hypothetical protein
LPSTSANVRGLPSVSLNVISAIMRHSHIL